MKSNREHCDHLERSSLKYIHWIQLYNYTSYTAPKPDLDPTHLLHFVCIIALIMKGEDFSQNCLETELNQFCLKYNKQ